MAVIISIFSTQTMAQQPANNLIYIIDHIISQSTSIQEKNNRLERLHNILYIASKYTDQERKQIIKEAKHHITKKLSKYDTLSQHKYPKTIQAWVDKHNAVRQTPVQPHPKLMQTAQIRAEHLSENIIKSNTHRRITGNYNYSQIENRFYEQGIIFENRNRTTFSESIAYGTVRCQSKECDKILANETQKSRQFLYTNEIARNWPHYRAIIQENFDYIGIGIAVNNGRYHIVIHYGTNINSPI